MDFNLMMIMVYDGDEVGVQCDQIGQFLKVLCNKFSCNSSPNTFLVTSWAISKNTTFK